MNISDYIDQAVSRLQAVNLVVIATADTNGRPWNTPVFAAYDPELTFYWASHAEAQHSRNIEATGRAFLVLFDSMTGHGGGLYVEAAAEAITDEAELTAALEVLSERRGRPYPVAKFLSDTATQRVYRATPRQMWVNRAERDGDGDYIRDQRHEVSLAELRARL